MSSYQQGQLTKEKNQKDILIIGGIQIFLPHSPEEAKVCTGREHKRDDLSHQILSRYPSAVGSYRSCARVKLVNRRKNPERGVGSS